MNIKANMMEEFRCDLYAQLPAVDDDAVESETLFSSDPICKCNEVEAVGEARACRGHESMLQLTLETDRTSNRQMQDNPPTV